MGQNLWPTAMTCQYELSISLGPSPKQASHMVEGWLGTGLVVITWETEAATKRWKPAVCASNLGVVLFDSLPKRENIGKHRETFQVQGNLMFFYKHILILEPTINNVPPVVFGGDSPNFLLSLFKKSNGFLWWRSNKMQRMGRFVNLFRSLCNVSFCWVDLSSSCTAALSVPTTLSRLLTPLKYGSTWKVEAKIQKISRPGGKKTSLCGWRH